MRSSEGDEIDVTYTTSGEKRNICRIYVGKSDRKLPLGRLRHNWEDTIEMDLREVGWVGMDCIHLSQNTGCFEKINLWFP